MSSFLSVRIDPPKSDEAVPGWLAGHATAQRPWLLAFADDGVIWGRWENGTLQTAHDASVGTDSAAISPQLRGVTLQQAYLFGLSSELRLWRGELGQWQAREIGDAADADYFDEIHLLHGDRVAAAIAGGFTHLFDAAQQGLDHIPPLRMTTDGLENGLRCRLRVRHYVAYDEPSGEARIALSRLVQLGVGPQAEERITR